MNQKTLLFLVFSLLLIGLGGGAAYLLIHQNDIRVVDQQENQASSLVTPTTVETESVIQVNQKELDGNEASESALPEGWSTYTNIEYGFEISYPEKYKPLNDSESLYGWPDAVVLFYAGGQSYDLAVEVWDSKFDYEDKYSTRLDDLVVKRVGDKYITLLNTNRETEVDQIIETFREIE